ncbi:MAG: hypothetical protein K8R54_02985 [Bacteroidales bacterium]|nr:hypothetical protein [Bacteroidales bacterium]
MIILVFITSQFCLGQIKDGIYRGEKGNIICISDDTISLRLFHGGAFNSYCYGIGQFSQKNKRKIQFFPMNFSNYTTDIKSFKKQYNDSNCIFSFKNYDNTPLSTAGITIRNKSGVIIYKGMSNEKGVIEINPYRKKIIAKYIYIEVSRIDFVALLKIKLKKYHNYTIKSKISFEYTYGTHLNEKHIFKLKEEEDAIIVKIGKNALSHKLIYDNSNYSIINSLFEK